MKMMFHLSFSILKPFLLFLTISTLACVEGCVEGERLALLEFKKSFASFPRNYGKLSSWNSSEEAENCCAWEGIACDSHISDHVTSLDLSNQDLESFQLPPSLLRLQHLKRLDLSSNNFSMRIPSFIGSFSKLTFLDLSKSGFFGMIPSQFANLSKVKTLDLSFNNFYVDNFQWISHISSLEILDMSSVNFDEARDWLSVIRELPFLSYFACSQCNFPTPAFPSTIPNHFNSSSSLQTLILSDSAMSSSTLSLFMNSTRNLSSLVVFDLYLEGPFPNIFDHMISLEELYISGNQLQVGTFMSIGRLCNLRSLYAIDCSIKRSAVDVLRDLTSCANDSLEDLYLYSNNLTGTIPPMVKFPSLSEMHLGQNHLESFEEPPNSTHHFFPPNLSHLYLSDNNLNGILLDEYFTNLSQLTILELSNNPNLTISFNEPPTEMQYLVLSSCNLGPNFPSWLFELDEIIYLDASQSNIFGSIPTTFWRNLLSSLTYLNLSSNNLYGILPNLPVQLGGQDLSLITIDLSSNAFYGPIPFFFFKANVLQLSKNKLSSFAPPLVYSTNNFSLPPLASSLYGTVNILDISDNSLSGEIPQWLWSQICGFNAVNLANNSLSGMLPSSTRYPLDLYVLNLGNNRFFGQLPSLLKNCTNMRILELSKNNFSGWLPSWIGEGLKSLIVLSLQSNNFTGTLPVNLCHVSSLQILQLSHNRLSGNIPSCLSSFVAMVHNVNLSAEFKIPSTNGYQWSPIEDADFYHALIKWKGMDRLFQKNLELVRLIDLSNNNLSGEIPIELSSLLELNSVDLSCNNLDGHIPNLIGKLKSLELLNLSYNKLTGQIPNSLSDLSSLGSLDFSHNNLSGRIPTGTQLQGFDASDFAENPNLCGLPLQVKCPGDVNESSEALQPFVSYDDGDKQYFYVGLGTGFAFGFMGILGTLTWITKWRYAFFMFATQFGEWILLVAALSNSKILRKFWFR